MCHCYILTIMLFCATINIIARLLFYRHFNANICRLYSYYSHANVQLILVNVALTKKARKSHTSYAISAISAISVYLNITSAK